MKRMQASGYLVCFAELNLERFVFIAEPHTILLDIIYPHTLNDGTFGHRATINHCDTIASFRMKCNAGNPKYQGRIRHCRR